MGFAVVKNPRSSLVWRFTLARRLVTTVEGITATLSPSQQIKAVLISQDSIQATLIPKNTVIAQITSSG